MDDRLRTILDERDLRRLADLYAQAIDRRDGALLVSLFTPDAVMTGPGWRCEGHEAITGLIDMLGSMFVSTWHANHNQVVTIDGDGAAGETYCSGRHLQKGGYAENQVLTLTLRYQDRFQRTDAGWLFAARNQIVDWTETATIQFGERR